MFKKIFLITIDSLRYDAIQKMPFLKSITNKTISCQNFFSNSCYTPVSVPSILTSLLPLDHMGSLSLSEGKINIAKILQQNGFTTIGFSSNVCLTKYFNYDQGFDYFEDFLKNPKKTFLNMLKGKFLDFFKKKKRLSKFFSRLFFIWSFIFVKLRKPYVDSQTLFEKFFPLIKKIKNDKVFNWVHLMDVHVPYYYPFAIIKKSKTKRTKRQLWYLDYLISFPEKINKQKKALLKELYYAGVTYIDGILKNFIEKVQSHHPEAVFIISADHGEELGEHNGFGHSAKLYDELVKIPFIIYGKRIRHKKFKKICSSVDIVPTILELAGISYSSFKNHLKGESIFQNNKRKHISLETVCSEKGQPFFNIDKINVVKATNEKLFKLYGIRNLKYKIIFSELDNKYELFDLEKDPEERYNVYEKMSSEKINYLKFLLNKRIKEVKEKEIISKLRI